MENKLLRIGIIGMGRISAVHISGLKHASDAKIVAICDIDEAKLNAAGDSLGIRPNTDLPITASL
jgi:predicted dehydrogenase